MNEELQTVNSESEARSRALSPIDDVHGPRRRADVAPMFLDHTQLITRLTTDVCVAQSGLRAVWLRLFETKFTSDPRCD